MHILTLKAKRKPKGTWFYFPRFHFAALQVWGITHNFLRWNNTRNIILLIYFLTPQRGILKLKNGPFFKSPMSRLIEAMLLLSIINALMIKLKLPFNLISLTYY